MHANYLTTELTELDWDSLAQNYQFQSMGGVANWADSAPSDSMMDQHHPRPESLHFHSTPQRSQSHPSIHANGLSQDPMMTAYLMQMANTSTDPTLDLSLADSQSWNSAMTQTHHHPERHPESQDQALEQFYRRYQQRAMAVPELPQAHYSQEIRQQQADQMRRQHQAAHSHHQRHADGMAAMEDRRKLQEGEYYRHLGIATVYNQHTPPVHPYFQLQDPPSRTQHYHHEQPSHRRSSPLALLDRAREGSPQGAIKYESPVGSLQLE